MGCSPCQHLSLSPFLGLWHIVTSPLLKESWSLRQSQERQGLANCEICNTPNMGGSGWPGWKESNEGGHLRPLAPGRGYPERVTEENSASSD